MLAKKPKIDTKALESFLDYSKTRPAELDVLASQARLATPQSYGPAYSRDVLNVYSVPHIGLGK